MSDAPDVMTHKTLPRAELAKFFRDSPRLRKAFEDLLLDVGVTLPDAISSSSESESSVLTQRAFIPQHFPAAVTYDAAGMILAGQIFGA
jgi:hypothetical protein